MLHCKERPRFIYHSLAHRHLVCFYLLTMVKNAAMNMCEYLRVPVFNSFGYIPRCRIIGYMVILCLSFLQNHQTFSKQLSHFIFLPAVNEGSNFSTFPPIPATFLFLDYSHPSEYEYLLQCFTFSQ